VIFPHLGYAEAVYAALADAGMQPNSYDVTVTGDTDAGGPVGGRELCISAEYHPSHRFVKASVMPLGFELKWRHTVGWMVHKVMDRRNDLLLPVPSVADPAVIGEVACDLGANGLPSSSGELVMSR
jgi:hypothetical protein